MTSFYAQAIYLVIGSLFALGAVAIMDETDSKNPSPFPFPVEMERKAKTLIVIAVAMAWPLCIAAVLVYAYRSGVFSTEHK
jgi:hypothetical protein